MLFKNAVSATQTMLWLHS